MIGNFNEQEAFLEKAKHFIKVKYRKSQTSSSNDGNLSCNGCTFIVKYMWCQESLYEFIFLCNICSESFNAMWEMMAHKKKKHLLNLRPCNYYIHGACELDARSYCFRGDIIDDVLLGVWNMGNFLQSVRLCGFKDCLNSGELLV